MKLNAIARRAEEHILPLAQARPHGLADPVVPLLPTCDVRGRGSPKTLPLELAMSNAPIPRKSLRAKVQEHRRNRAYTKIC